MRLIGLTGGIATGKSTVASMLAARGAAVVDADRLAREVVAPGSSGFDAVVERFGTEVVTGSGDLDRAALGRIVFADPGRRAALESITHPRINALMAQRIADALGSDAPLVVADIPLLFESGRADRFEATLLVYVPADVQVARLRAREGLDDADARRRLASQLPIDEKRSLATWVIDNDGSVADTEAQVARWWASVVG